MSHETTKAAATLRRLHMPSSGSELPVFDPVAIEKLRKVAGDGDGFVAEMAQLFKEETEKSLADLKSASERNDWKAVSRVAHSLKSSAATLGFLRLSNACKTLEHETNGGAPSARTAALLASVFELFAETGPILKDLR